jgi:tetratricopeptide (TPR) repeat protein
MRNPSAYVCILVAILASACASTNQVKKNGSERVALNGMVYDFDNRPVSDAEISVDGHPVTRSDINGRFSLGEISFGQYKVDVSKKGYETASIPVDYSDVTQIIYAKVFSAKQLLTASEKEAESRNWAGAVAFLDRIDAIGVKDPAAHYLRAVIYFREGEAQEARKILESLLSDGYDEPYVHLFLADLLQYSLADASGAVEHLEIYLKSRYDPDVEQRLQLLRSSAK